MREIYAKKQKLWQQFREAERQRRIDKANQEELDRLAGILAKSRARREYTEMKFYQTNTIRSYYNAAVVIQRAFRRAKHRKSWLRMRTVAEEVRRRMMENKAACIIQKAWRQYRQQRLYEALHFKSILTGPVITLASHPSSFPGRQESIQSYQRNISITGQSCTLAYT